MQNDNALLYENTLKEIHYTSCIGKVKVNTKSLAWIVNEKHSLVALERYGNVSLLHLKDMVMHYLIFTWRYSNALSQLHLKSW